MLKADGWLGLAIALGGFAGPRSGEVRALEVRDIDFDNQRIMVTRAMSENTLSTTKSGHERTVDLVPALAERLAIAVAGKASTDRIVVLETGRTPTRQELLGRFKTFLRRAKLQERSFHSLRHFFVSEMVRKGASVEAVRELAGHTSLVVTQRYAHANEDDRRAAVNKLAP